MTHYLSVPCTTAVLHDAHVSTVLTGTGGGGVGQPVLLVCPGTPS